MTISKFSVKNKRNKINEIIITLFVFVLIFILLSNPVHYSKTLLQGILLFSNSVLPGLFPFMLLTRILTNLGSIQKLSVKLEKPMRKLFHCPGISAYALIMSNLSGYPIGAKIVGDLYTNNLLDDNEVKRTLSFSMTSGPVFVIGTVGGLILGSIRAGIIIFTSHIISNIIAGLILCNLSKNKNKTPTSKQTISITSNNINFDKILSDSMYSSVQAILLVGGFISIFYCFTEILFDLKIFNILSFPLSSIFSLIGVEPRISLGVMSGIAEVTRGIKDLSIYFLSNPKLVTALCSAIISFSGVSIILQSKAFLNHTKIKTHFLIISKSVHAIICFIICLIISYIFM